MLKGKRYGIDEEAIVAVINSLFEEPGIVFESGRTFGAQSMIMEIPSQLELAENVNKPISQMH